VQIKISARHGHLSDETQGKIKEKLEKLPRYYDRLSSIDATVDLEHRDAPDVDLRVSADHKHDFVAVCRSTELMAAVDEVVEKMEQQLVKYKTKIQDRHRAGGHRQAGETLPPESPEDAEAPADTESGL
jgi:putative sigma-54 modulation protein